MRYYVRSSYGEAEFLYDGKRVTPYQGTCQGNGASQSYWLIITMIMVLVMHKKRYVLELKYPLTNDELRCMGFFDDTNLIVIAKKKH